MTFFNRLTTKDVAGLFLTFSSRVTSLLFAKVETYVIFVFKIRKTMSKKAVLLCWLSLACIKLPSQSLSPKVVASGGGFKTTSSGSLSFTIGEPAIITLKKDSSILTQGFQQGVMKKNSSLVSFDAGSISINLFPSPASSYLEFEVSTSGNEQVGITIFDILGNKICDVQDIKTSGSQHHAVQGTSDLPDGIYIALISVRDVSGSTQFFSRRFLINN
jgi:hypothetical protein